MAMEQEREWTEAQKITVSIDLVEAAKTHLKFLAAVDRNRFLYEDHALKRAIYRYNAFWLPLLAKHLESPISEEPLVVPLDCEWIWHCHRLNPIRYKLDCQKLYGRILSNHNVISSAEATPKSRTKEIWNKMYPKEPYELDINRSFSEVDLQKGLQDDRFTSYDLVSAVKRQISFTYQVSRSHVSDDLFLKEAEARYKGFLHIIRTNQKMGVNRYCVPTYDVDLMWHTHQLHPYFYCMDLTKILGMVLQHDDTDSDKSKGSKLDTGFTETTKQWEEIFGKRYWKAGAMNIGSTPTPVTRVPSDFKYNGKGINSMEICDILQLSSRKSVEVFLEFVEIKNLPEGHKDNLVVSFSKKQPDKLFNMKRSLSIFSQSGEKQVAYFECEPTGEFLFELKSQSPSDKLTPKPSKDLGYCSLSLQELLDSRSQLSAEKWLSVDPVSGLKIFEPILLHVSVSFTPPTPAPLLFRLEQHQDTQPVSAKAYVRDDDGKVIFNLQMRNIVKDATKCTPEMLKTIHYITDSGEEHKVAEFLGGKWAIRGIDGILMLQNNSGNDGHLFELLGNKMVKLFPGRRLDFEPRECGNRRCEQDFITAINFSADHPYGRAIALLDLKLGTIKALDEWIVLPGIILGFILSDISIRERYNGFTGHNGDKMAIESACICDLSMVKSDICDDLCNSATMVKSGGLCVTCAACGGCGDCGVSMLENNLCGDLRNSAQMVKSGGLCVTCAACGGCGDSGVSMLENNLCGDLRNSAQMVKSGGLCVTCVACGGCGDSGVSMLESNLCGDLRNSAQMVKSGGLCVTCAACGGCGDSGVSMLEQSLW